MELQFIPEDILDTAKGLDCILGELHPTDISELLNSSVLAGGKRLRPMLLFLIAKHLGLKIDELVPHAICVEQIHAASLAHDDVIDEATTRRQRPSINALSSNKYAVLAGDYLLADVIWRLAELDNIEILQESSKVIKDLSLGEWIQLKSTESQSVSFEDILDVAELKTGSVMGLCAAIPGIIHGDEKVAVALRDFGRSVGIAFQLVDDVLDFSGDPQKEPFNDLKNGQLNAVIYKLFDLSAELKDTFYQGKLTPESISSELLEQAKNIVKDVAKEKIEYAKRIITEIPGHQIASINGLLDLIVLRDY
ncbi:MAG: polyprenyl synthetase family protein [Bacteriovoracaceae bacterium]|nr:polyprenyl synthetase family protein [Bacteriovoracaceae bacterium]